MSLVMWLFGILCLAIGGVGLLALSSGLIVPRSEQVAQEHEEEVQE